MELPALQGQRHRQRNLQLLQLPLQEKLRQVSITVGAIQHNTNLGAVKREPQFPPERSLFFSEVCGATMKELPQQRQAGSDFFVGKRRFTVTHRDP